MRKPKPIVIYERFGNTYIRSNCDKMNQTAATKASAKIFGKASNTGAVMRSLLEPVIPNAKDGTMHRRFQTCLQNWLLTMPFNDPLIQNDIPFVTGFQFNTKSDLCGRCKIGMQVNRAVTGSIILSIPSFVPVDKIVAPAYTGSLQLNIAAAGYNFQTKTVIGGYSSVIDINYNDALFPPAELQIGLPTGAGNLIIVAAGITYYAMRNGSLVAINDMRWMPAGIVSGLYN